MALALLHCDAGTSSVDILCIIQRRKKRRSVCNATKPCQLDIDRKCLMSRRGWGLLTFLSSVSSSRPAYAQEDNEVEQLQPNMCVYKPLSSRLEYCDMVEGAGKAPVKGNVIKLHYTGSMENGQVFDSSFDRGEPLSFQLNAASVMKGVYQAILGSDEFPGMKPGGRRLVRVPPELGYGNNPGMCPRYFSGPCVVPPNSVLIYDLHYLGLWTSDEDTRPFHLFT